LTIYLKQNEIKGIELHDSAISFDFIYFHTIQKVVTKG